ncbi:unnamed protein product [Closterium sp. NIES-64]|nr:unnamed protein product [Closterium sp. NIES-64]
MLPTASRAACRLANPAELVPPVIPAALRLRLISAAMATAAFPSLSSIVASAASALWSANLTLPYPTNASWQNFVLGQGGNPELVTPYIVQSAEGRVAWGLPLSTYDDLSATLSFRQPSSAPSDPPALEVPLVRGSPLLTFIFPPGGPPATPMLTTIHAITGDGSALVADAPFMGTMRVALLTGSSSALQDEEAPLDAHVPMVPLGGSAQVGEFLIEYTWRTQQWCELANGETNAPPPLLMLSLPSELLACAGAAVLQCHLQCRHKDAMQSFIALIVLHRRMECTVVVRANAFVPDASVLAYPTIDGQAVGMQGGVWRLNVPKRPSTWEAGPLSSDAQLLDELRGSLKQDVAALPPLSSPSTYSFSKAAARVARLALIAKQVQDDDSLAAVLPPLRTALSTWLDGTFPGNPLLYDPTWGGVRKAASPRLRHFDAYALHSWASGLFEFGDGCNQESFSEEASAYYAGALLASVLGEKPLASSNPDPSLTPGYEAVFADANRVVGVMWSTKRDAGLWFAPSADMEKRVGI